MSSTGVTQLVIAKNKSTFDLIIKILALCCICSCMSCVVNTSRFLGSFSNTKAIGIDTEPTQSSPSSAGGEVTKKPAKLSVFNNCDCQSDEVSVTTFGAGISKDIEAHTVVQADDQWKCITGTNVLFTDYVHEYSGTTNGLPVNGAVVYNERDHSKEIRKLTEPIKVGCSPGQNYRTNKLDIKWKVLE